MSRRFDKDTQSVCAPGRYDAKHNTCFTVNQLVDMAKAYNRYMSKVRLNPRKGVKGVIDPNDMDLIMIKPDKKYLLKEFYKRFSHACGRNEVCLTQQDFMNEIVQEMFEDIHTNTFRPHGPTKNTDWLSTQNINEIMEQYESIVPDFKFLGAVPLNCDELPFCSLYNINYDSYLKNKINRIGIVFNHDKYGKDGSHWVALLLDIKNGTAYFSDSMAGGPIGNIKKVINDFAKFYQDRTGQQLTKKINKIRYQRDRSECGVYSCNFIIRLLSGETFEDIVTNPLVFKQINACRSLYFRNVATRNNIQEIQMCDPLSLGHDVRDD